MTRTSTSVDSVDAAVTAGELAPLAIFVHRRISAALQVLEALSNCAEFGNTTVFIFSDGPRNEIEREHIRALRRAIQALPYPNIQLIAREHNLGLAESITSGVSQLSEEYGKVIVLEDDHRPMPAMLRWFNTALDTYATDERVGAISGHIFDVREIRRHARAVFFRHPASSCWAVWNRSWRLYDAKCEDWQELMRNRVFRNHFRVYGAMRFEQMMRDQRAGRSDSWAIRWHASLIRSGKLVLYPPQSMVVPLKTDSASASHGIRTESLLSLAQPWARIDLPPLPEVIEADEWAIRAWARSLRYSAYGAAHMLAAIRYEWKYRKDRVP